MTAFIRQGYIGNPAQPVMLRRVTVCEGRAKGTGNIEVKTAWAVMPSGKTADAGTVGSALLTGIVSGLFSGPDEAAAFCKDTGIDALAPSFGTAHGIYRSKPVLDFDRVKAISEKTGLPLVMHGGSGVSPGDYRTGIRCGLRRINYYSYMARAGVIAVKDLLAKEDVTFFHDLALAAQKAMEADVEKAMRVFAGM